MTTKIVVVSHPECPDSLFELRKNSWLAFVSELKPPCKIVNGRRVHGSRAVLATSEKNIQLFAKKIATHLDADVTLCDCLMGKGDFDCVDDYVVDEIEFLVVIAARDVTEALVSYLSVIVGHNAIHLQTMEMRPAQIYTF